MSLGSDEGAESLGLSVNADVSSFAVDRKHVHIMWDGTDIFEKQPQRGFNVYEEQSSQIAHMIGPQ